MRPTLAFSLGAILASSFLFVQTEAQQQACNGYPELCSRPYSKVAFATAHNAYAFSPPGGLAINQNNDIPTQLKDGVRAFMLDAYNVPSGSLADIQLCHTSCQMVDGGPLSKTLGLIKTFMDANPNEIITILWENSQNLAPARFQTVYAAAGLVSYSHTQAVGAAAWPTLAQMVASNKRLVSFLDSGADASVPWLMAEYDFVFETPYTIPTGTAYPCTIDRPKGQKKQMYVLNHFVSGQFKMGDQTVNVPQPSSAEQTNGAELSGHITNCQQVLKQMPNFIAVDFYDKGSLMQAVAQTNGVQWNGKGPTTGPGQGTGAGAGKGGAGNAASSSMSFASTKAMGALAIAGGLGFLAL